MNNEKYNTVSFKSHSTDGGLNLGSFASNASSVANDPTGIYNSNPHELYFPANDEIDSITTIGSRSIESLRLNALSHIPSSAHSNPLVRSLSMVIDAVKDDNLITEKEKQEAGLPKTEFGLMQEQFLRRASLLSIYEPHADTERDPSSDEDPSLGIPDGGYAWVIAVCSCLFNISTWGSNASYGVFLNYYLSSNYFPGATNFDFAMVGGLVIGLAYTFSPFAFILVAYIGLKPTVVLGVVIQTAGYILASFATKTWQLYLTEGVMIGISFSLVFTAGVAILSNWFYHRRALASGIMTGGTGLGGILFALSSQKLMEVTGNHKWPLRMVGMITFVLCAISLCLTKQYPKTFPKHKLHPSRPPLGQAIRVVLNPKIITFFPIHVVSFWYACVNTGYVILLFSTAAYASSLGLTREQGSIVTAVMNVGQLFGRPGMGYLSDRLGRINFSILMTLSFGVLVLVFWVNARTYGSLIAWSLVCGMTIGIASVNNQPLALDVAGTDLFPTAYSYMNILVAIPLTFAEVIALKMKDDRAHSARPFLSCQLLTGALFFAGGFSLFILREIKIRKLLTERQAVITRSTPVYVEGDKEILTRGVDEVRLRKYKYLLRGGTMGYVSRMIYPIKV
ncbi:hypothetical protein BABINDRAFT_159686 [Babjeviella inositovora NRRL Y-12698]|uniref:Major facilitator superfamily (MFS) profile domain-containing protein n=1 Tax=Babjeviella inositovora NRRL Y-12698 TaxID=984486 RepID=A0A1E3R042_9ASCO|nr:uncharacterized protein BABINDRAFT_159686 [Babjeviella inositovora NRRL Y-12698]ODQ83251.1 hypothetical protein BABINDRAFT_159686 [Babjeviella inositovora NRRL Y-12698]